MFGRRTPEALAELAAMPAGGSPAERAGMARVMGDLLNAELSSAERGVAKDIVTILCEDAVESVRKALAQSVAASPHLPRSVARRLAMDIEEVSIPVLEVSTVLSDGDLREVIRRGTPRQLEATARRAHVSEDVSDAIVERGHVPAISLLVRNDGACLSAETWQKAIERHGEAEELVTAAGARGPLPEAVAAKLLEVAKAHVRSFVVRYLNVPQSVIPATDDLKIEVGIGRRVTPVVPEGAEPNAYAELLHRDGRLTRKTLVQALCAGEFVFLAAALGRLAELPFVDVQRQLFSASERARLQVLERAGLEPAMAGVFQSLLSMGNVTDLAEYQRLALDRVATDLGCAPAATEAA